MRCRTYISIVALAALIALAGSFTSLAQEEPRDAEAGPVDITVPPAPVLPAKAEAETPAAADEGAADAGKSEVKGVSGPKGERRIEQRVDGLNPVKIVKPERKTPKNVMRIDNKKKRKVQAVAVIKAPMAPWGYTNRYIQGDVAQTENTFQVPGAQGIAGQGHYGNLRGGLMGSGSRRDEEDEDY